MRAVIFAVFISALIYAPLSAVSAQEIDANQIRALSGYKSYGTLSSFTKHLREDPVLYRALSSNQKLSEKILGSTTLQRKLLGDINKSGDSQSVVSSYVNEFSQTGNVTGNAFGQTDSFAKQEEQRQQRRELNQQQLSGDEDGASKGSQRLGSTNGNANLAAQRAIEQAQRDRESAERRAKEMIAQAQTQLDAKNEQEKFQSEMLRFKAVQDMISQIAHDPAALDAFWADTQMLQKLMDNEMTIEDAMAKLGVTPAPGTTAPAPEPIPHTTPDPSDDTIFGDGFEGGGNQGLVHVSGNHYRLNGMDVWDMNHIPEPSEQQLDANGWPKYLNVPASCPPPRENTKYLHRAHYNYDGGGDPANPYFKRSKHSLGDMGAHFRTYFMGSSWFYTSLRIGNPAEGLMSEEVAYPFVSSPQPDGMFQAIVGALNWATATEVQSISHCPGDFTGVTPAGKDPLPEGCKGGMRKYFGPKPVIAAVKYQGDKGHNVDCEVSPGQRYFHNFQPYQVYQLADENGSLSEADFAGKLNNSGRDSYSSNFVWVTPPYANACLGSGDDKTTAFPINYPGQRYSVGYSHTSCGRTSAPQSGCENREKRSVCYDVTGQRPPSEFVQECQGGNLVWIKGYGEKALSTYKCENFKSNGDFVYNSVPVCAAHREGETRKQVVNTKRNYVVHNQYQCQYDKELNRYDWHLVSSEEKGYAGSSGSSSRYSARMVEPPNGAPTFDPVPHKETCAWNGEEHPLGTKMIQDITMSGSFPNKRIGKHTYICMQRGPEPALPRFTHTEIRVSPEAPFNFLGANGDEAYSVTFEAPPAGYEQSFVPKGPHALGEEQAGEEDFSDKPKVDFSHNLPLSGASCSTLDNIGHSHGWTGNLYNRQKVSCKSSCSAAAVASQNPAHHERVRCNNGQYEKCQLINDQTDITCNNVRIQTGGGNRLELCAGPVPPAGCPTSGIDPASYRTAGNTFNTSSGSMSVTLRSQPVFANNAYASCSQMACRACLTTDNQAMPHGWSGGLYPTNSVSCENCPAARACACDDGVFEGACTKQRFGTNLEKWKYRHQFPQWQEEVIREFYTSCNAERSSCQWQTDGTVKGSANITALMVGGGVGACQGEPAAGNICSGRGDRCAVFEPGSIDPGEDLQQFICK